MAPTLLLLCFVLSILHRQYWFTFASTIDIDPYVCSLHCTVLTNMLSQCPSADPYAFSTSQYWSICPQSRSTDPALDARELFIYTLTVTASSFLSFTGSMMKETRCKCQEVSCSHQFFMWLEMETNIDLLCLVWPPPLSLSRVARGPAFPWSSELYPILPLHANPGSWYLKAALSCLPWPLKTNTQFWIKTL